MDQSSQSVHGTQINAARDIHIEQLGDKVYFSGQGDIRGHIQYIVQEAASQVKEIRHAEKYISEKLAKGMQRSLESLLKPNSHPKFSKADNPYRLLQSFETADASLFFGREEDIAATFAHLNQPITIISAESGVGKTSLLKAGIAGRLLKAGHLPVYIRPHTRDPVASIKNWFLSDVLTAHEMQRIRDESLTAFLHRVLELRPDKRERIVFLIDQFEEFFYHVSETKRQEFAQQLSDAREQLSERIRWIFAIRGDAYTRLGEFHPLLSFSFAETHQLQWNREQAIQSIVKSAEFASLHYDPTLPEEIVDALARKNDSLSPVHIQIVCHTIVDQTDPPQLSLSKYRELGSMEGIIHSWLNRVLEQLSDARDAGQYVLENLVDSQSHRVRRSFDELDNGSHASELIRNAITQLVINGLIVQYGAKENATYELVHDFLGERIQLVPEVMTRKLAGEMLAQDARLYEHDPSSIIAPERLKFIQQHLDNSSKALSGDLAHELLKKSVRHKQRKRLQSAAQVFLVAAFAIALIVVIRLNRPNWSPVFHDDPVFSLTQSSDGTIYAGTQNKGVAYSTDSELWTISASGLPTVTLDGITYVEAARHLTVNPIIPNQVFAHMADRGIYTNNNIQNSTWQNINGDLPSDLKITSLTAYGKRIVMTVDGGEYDFYYASNFDSPNAPQWFGGESCTDTAPDTAYVAFLHSVTGDLYLGASNGLFVEDVDNSIVNKCLAWQLLDDSPEVTNIKANPDLVFVSADAPLQDASKILLHTMRLSDNQIQTLTEVDSNSSIKALETVRLSQSVAEYYILLFDNEVVRISENGIQSESLGRAPGTALDLLVVSAETATDPDVLLAHLLKPNNPQGILKLIKNR